MSFTTPSWSSALLRSLAPHSAMGWLHLRSPNMRTWDTGSQNVEGLRVKSDKESFGLRWRQDRKDRAQSKGKQSVRERLCVRSLQVRTSLSVRGWGCASRGQRLHSSSPLHSKPWDRHKGRNRLGEMFLCPVKRKPATFNLRTDKGECCLEQKNAPSSHCGGHRISQSLRNSLRSTG